MTPLQRRPSLRLVLLCGSLLALAVIAELGPLVFEDGSFVLFDADARAQLWQALAVALFTLSVLDLSALGHMKLPTVKRTLPTSLALPFDGFDSVDPRIKRQPLDLPDSSPPGANLPLLQDLD